VNGEPESDGHVMTGTLTCGGCTSAYPIERGVPRFVAQPQAGRVERTVDGFGYQWRSAEPALKDARFGAAEIFLDFIAPIDRAFFPGKVVLDAGCGGGRFSLLSAAFGARLVVGVDLSQSVDVAFDKTRHLANVLIVQADVLTLPVRRAFDYAFSIGVLHHTANPRAAFLEVASKVLPGGTMTAWVYSRENNEWIVHLLDPVRRITSRLPRPMLLAAAHAVAVPLTLAVKLIYGPIARSRRWRSLGRHLFYFDYLVFLAQFGYREHAYIVFDHAVPSLAEYIARDDFEEWFSAAGLEGAVVTSRAGNSWRGVGRAPGAPTSRGDR
jgi:SAM-dependent methyltransferase